MSIKISDPLEVRHVLHIDQHLNWEFDESTDLSAAFVKERDIGKGGFGTVCKIRHVESGVILAGKVISPEVMNRSTKEALMHEVKLLRQIRTPWTIQYFGSVLYRNSVMIMMEYCDRGSLRDCLDYHHCRLNENQIRVVMRDLLMAISTLHKKYKIIHRDVKAANILLTKKGELRVTDFGVSKQFDVGQTANTCSVIGTPYWMAPEVVYGMKYSYPADVWSIGATAVELLEGLPPYGELPVMRAIVELGRTGFAGFRKGTKISPVMRDFCLACLTKDPEARATPEQLLKHEFLRDVDNLDRLEVLGPLIKEEIDFEKLMGSKQSSGRHSSVKKSEIEELQEEEEEDEEQEEMIKEFKKRNEKCTAFVTEPDTNSKDFPNLVRVMASINWNTSSKTVLICGFILFLFMFLLLQKFGIVPFALLILAVVIALYYFHFTLEF